MAATTTLNDSTHEVTHNAKVLRPIRRGKTTKEMFEDFYQAPTKKAPTSISG